MSYDAAIVGAGPAGALSAYLLARQGRKVILLEKNPSPPRKVCGEYLCPQGVALLESLDLSAVLEQTRPIRGMKIVTPKGTPVLSQFPAGEGRAVNRRHFDGALIKLAKNQGADVKEGVTVADLSYTSGLWTLQTGQGPVTAKFVIGADGRSSVISKKFDNDVQVAAKRVAIHGFVNSLRTNDFIGEMHLYADGSYIGVDPTGGFEVNLSLVANADSVRELGGPGRALFHYLNQSDDLRERFAVGLVGVKLSTTFPIQHQTKSLIPAKNIALVGDAAGFVDPLTGEGIYNALLSAHLLTKALAMDFKRAPKIYQRSYVKHLNGKARLNKVFQLMLHRPWLVEQIAGFLLRGPKRADTFIGIVGNVYSPREGLARLLF